MTAQLVASPPGTVSMEWPAEDIAEEFRTINQHAALITAARREAERLGARIGDGAPITERLVLKDAFRFTWSSRDYAEWTVDHHQHRKGAEEYDGVPELCPLCVHPVQRA